jgi:hypothetical protein
MTIRTEFDALTGKTVEIKLTNAELAQLEANTAAVQANIAARQSEENAKVQAKQAVLTKLGLTAEEAAALLA